MVKRGDRLKYFIYKFIIMDPAEFILSSALILAICTYALLPNFSFLAYLVVVVCFIDCILFASRRHKRVNDYIVLEINPFSHCSAIYQVVKRNKSHAHLSFEEKQTLYLNQMQKVLGLLPPGSYKTITQPMFTRAILKCSRVTIIKQEKAYRKRIDALMHQVYHLDICPKHNSFTQFYYSVFELDK